MNTTLANGGFESPLDSDTDWSIRSTPTTAVVRQDRQPHGGLWRLFVGAEVDHEAEVSQALDVVPGTYTLSVYTLSGGGRSRLFARDASGKEASVAIEGSGDLWRNLTLEVEVAQGPLTVGLATQAAAGQWFVADDVSLAVSVVGAEADRSGGLETAPWVGGGTQTLTNLKPGTYTLTAWVQNPGAVGGNLSARPAAGAGRSVPLPRTDFPCDRPGAWKKVTLRGLEVKSGTLTVALDGGECRLEGLKLDRDDRHYQLLIGGDITELTYVEAQGGRFHDGEGQPVDPVAFAASRGWNIVRIREYNRPGRGRGSADGAYYLPDGFQDSVDALGMCRRARAADLAIQYSFHYSDWWTNPATQNLPADWAAAVAGLDDAKAVDRLETLVFEYTRDVLARLAAEGIELQSVALGNEIRGGMLFPYGTTARWDNLARFLNAGARAVRLMMPGTPVLIHLDDGGNVGTYREFLGQARARGVDYDQIGTSYYPFWTNKTALQFGEFCRVVGQEFGKPLLCMETAVNWTSHSGAGNVGQLEHNGPYGDRTTSSPALQRDFLVELFNAMEGVDEGLCLGDLYWDPVMLYAGGRTGWAIRTADDSPDPNMVDNTTLFDFEGRALPAWEAYRRTRNS